MTEGYEIPKRQIDAEMVLAGEEPRRIRLFLAERAQRHSGPERPSDLLNATEEDFFPVREVDAGFTLVHRDAVLVLSVPRSAEAGPEQDLAPADGADSATAASGDVRVRMEDGREVSGTVREEMPVGERRIQDVLNRAEAFVPVRDGEVIRFVNRARIARVTLL